MSKFLIEKNVPMSIGTGGKYPFYEMEVGDSFLIPATDANESVKLRNSIRSNIRFWRRSKNLKLRRFVARDVVVDGAYGVRVWRVEDNLTTP